MPRGQNSPGSVAKYSDLFPSSPPGARLRRECDIFISLFSTKTGKYTEEEFDFAHRQFKDTGKPRIYTYFKNENVKIGSIREQEILSLLSFKEKLGHFYTSYDNIDHLKHHFRNQLDLLYPAN